MTAFDILSWIVVLYGIGQIAANVIKHRGRLAAILDRRNRRLAEKLIRDADAYRADKSEEWMRAYTALLIALFFGFSAIMFNTLDVVTRHPEHQLNIAVIFIACFAVLMSFAWSAVSGIFLFEKLIRHQDSQKSQLEDNIDDGDGQ